MFKTTVILLVSIFVCAPANVGAQHHGGHRQTPHESVDFSKTLPAPKLMDGIGDSSLKVTTKSEQAQQYFNQGLRLLHCFWDFEALRAFRAAVRLEPDLAMAHWGIYKAIGYNKSLHEEKRQSLAKAVQLSANAGDYERKIINAYAALEDKEKGEEIFIREMETLIDRYPQDIEARLFLALHLMSGYDADGRPKARQIYSQQILSNILQTHPKSAAAHHYWIHALETSSRPEAALESAAKLPELAPRSGHIVHMPGHIFNRVGDYKKAHESFAASVRVDEAYMKAENVQPADNWNYAHNLSYLVANLAEAGRYKESLQWAEKLKKIPAAATRANKSVMYLMFEGGTLARLHIRFGEWQRVVDETLAFGVVDDEVSDFTRQFRDGILHYARGMSAAEKNDLKEAARQAEKLEALLKSVNAAEFDAKDYHSVDVPKILQVAALDLRGEVLSREGKHDESLKLLTEAARREREIGYFEPPIYSRPALETLGEAALRAGFFGEARRAFEQALVLRPNSGFAIYGLARTFAAENNGAEAEKQYRRLLAVWTDADQNLPQLRQAKSWLEKRK